METTAPEPRPTVGLAIVNGLITAFFLAAGVFLVLRGWPAVIEGFGMRDWREGAGWVVEARMPEIVRERTDYKSKAFYTLELVYDYEAAGRTYRGERTGLFPDTAQWQPAKAFVRSHPTGTALRVWHDPRNPARSILDPSIGAGTWFMAIAGLPLMVGGGVGLVGVARTARLVLRKP